MWSGFAMQSEPAAQGIVLQGVYLRAVCLASYMMLSIQHQYSGFQVGYSSAVQGGGFWGRFDLREYVFDLTECCAKPF